MHKDPGANARVQHRHDRLAHARTGNGAAHRLLIVDDQPICREGLRVLFRETPDFQVAAVESGEAMRMAEYFAPQLAMISLALPGHYAFQLARGLRQVRPATGILFLDDEVRHANIPAALAAGALGYWARSDSFDDLAEAARTVAAGRHSFCPGARPYIVETSSGPQFRPDKRGREISRLTRREVQVLSLLVKGFSVKECAAHLNLAPSTVDNFTSRLMKKLGVHNRVDLVMLAVREGLDR
jgi:DNA-binding NarL/FixJ family response regulator